MRSARRLPPRGNRPETPPPNGLALLELERRRVDAVAKTGRVRPVREDVAEVPATRCAHDLGAHHAVARVDLLVDRSLACGFVERRPAAARVELRLRDEELGPAAGAAVGARLEDVVVLTRERRLGSLVPQNPVLLRIERGPPLGVGLDNLAQLTPFVHFWLITYENEPRKQY